MSTKAIFEGAGEFQDELRHALCVMPISVGQYYHEGDKLASTLRLLERRIARCHIVVCDSLQRHTLPIFYPDLNIDIASKSRKLGHEWLMRNRELLRTLSIPYSISHWDDWLLSDEYTKQRELVDLAYSQKGNMFRAINATVAAFLERNIGLKSMPNDSYLKMQEHCFEYVKEECSVMPLWISLNAQFEVYPGKRTLGMAASYQEFVQAKYPDLLRWIRINHRARKVAAA
ncbi:MAG: hypothetical protein CMF50_00750 [Legionellales bacterium]|nr:hypothetical protein [Legionellales bacterium]|tara:strand:- start:10857 stop:11546 length:690 start_codon:yes stop_codon:yes gene_type:complete